MQAGASPESTLLPTGLNTPDAVAAAANTQISEQVSALQAQATPLQTAADKATLASYETWKKLTTLQKDDAAIWFEFAGAAVSAADGVSAADTEKLDTIKADAIKGYKTVPAARARRSAGGAGAVGRRPARGQDRHDGDDRHRCRHGHGGRRHDGCRHHRNDPVTEFELERFEAADDAELIVVAGTVGALEAQELTETLEACGRDGARRVVVDVTDAEIDDPDALSGLYDLARLMRARDGLVAIAAPRKHVLRGILETTGVTQAFTLYDSRRAALDDLDLDG